MPDYLETVKCDVGHEVQLPRKQLIFTYANLVLTSLTWPPLLAFLCCIWLWSFKFQFHSVGLVSLVPVLLLEVSYLIYFKLRVTKNRK